MADKFEGFVDATIDNMVSIVKTVTGTDAVVKMTKAQDADVNQAGELLASYPLALRAPFKTGFTGGAVFLFRVEDATALADIFIGGPGTKSPDLTADMLDAVLEIFNQLAGGLKTRLSADLGTPVALGPFEACDFRKEGHGSLATFLAFTPGRRATIAIKLGSSLDTDMHLFTSALSSQAAEKTATAGDAAQGASSTGNPNLDLIMDVRLPLTVRFGQTRMVLKDVLKLGTGSIIELDKNETEPVEVMVNEKILARGEVVVVDGNYGVRILEIESPASRIRSLS